MLLKHMQKCIAILLILNGCRYLLTPKVKQYVLERVDTARDFLQAPIIYIPSKKCIVYV